MMAKALGDVSGETNVCGCETMLVMNVSVMESADGRDLSIAAFLTMLANELGHGPRFERRAMGPKLREMPNQDADQLAFDIPEVGQKLPLLLRSEQV